MLHLEAVVLHLEAVVLHLEAEEVLLLEAEEVLPLEAEVPLLVVAGLNQKTQKCMNDSMLGESKTFVVANVNMVPQAQST